MMKYITNLSRDELDKNVVIGCESEDNYPCILIKNCISKVQLSSLATDNLAFSLNTLLTADGESFYYHIIKSKKNDYVARQQFKIIYDYIFNRITEPIEDTTLYELVESLQEYFTITPDSDNYALQVGVFGELLSIKVLYDAGYTDIVNKYHKNFFSKHDIEVDNNTRIEIKTTEKEIRIHGFKHNQIYRKDIAVYVISVMLEPSQEGLSLYELFLEVMKFYGNPDAIFSLEKLMKQCNVSEEASGIRVSLQKAMNEIRFFRAEDLPRIECEIPRGVSSVSYNVDCSFAESMAIGDFVALLWNL